MGSVALATPAPAAEGKGHGRQLHTRPDDNWTPFGAATWALKSLGHDWGSKGIISESLFGSRSNMAVATDPVTPGGQFFGQSPGLCHGPTR